MNYEAITIQDCLDNYFMKNVAAVINDGQVIEFVKENEKKLSDTANIRKPNRK
ncbi:hypothetical protein [Anaerocolumna chitinilytica]|uniref:Uncharacterized protein n=1 Tax=Anaerocolumna chitinilytica TaxID=1727145 RepID=A0A7I8DIE0_9FIRM|nr:hypothetical protein [Anaerocolumna chitinilytica]BCJ98082.1 hypothetical protein bsdcttw_11230 [Anaerocolumna chitinilytica]